MNKIINYGQIRSELTFVTDFNDSTALYIHKPGNRLFVIKRVSREAKDIYEKLSAITNPHLACVRNIADNTDYIEIMQDYISGMTLEELLTERGTLTQEETGSIICDVCDGLNALHKNGLAHRDVNPNNIVIAPNGSATIIDYGITRSFRIGKKSDTEILGTPGYAAPEQFGFSQSDSRTDIYAVGVMMNVMLTGDLPNVKPAEGMLGRTIRKCTEIDAGKRYKSIAALSASIRSADSDRGMADRIVSCIPGLRSKNVLVVIMAFVGYIAAAFASFFLIYAGVREGKTIGMIITWLFLLPIPFFWFHNFLGIPDRLPFICGSSKRSRIIVRVCMGLMSIFIGFLIFSCIHAFG